MKKIISYLLVAIMLLALPLSLFGCNDDEDVSDISVESENESVETEESKPMIIISDNPDYKNVALNKSYEKSSLYPDDNNPSYPDEEGKSMTDGIIAPEKVGFSDKSFMGFNKNSYDYAANSYALLTVDLGELYYLDKFVAHVGSEYYLSAGINAPMFVWIYASDDNINWHKIGRTVRADSPESNTVAATLELESAISARYIQYRFVGDSNWIMVCEVEAFGIKGEEPIPYPETDDELDFLFVGNSSTYFFNVPCEFMFIAESAGIKVDITSCCIGSAYLRQFADENDETRGKLFRSKIAEKKYDYVVLQDNSGADFEDSKPAMDILVPIIKNNGAEILLYKRYSSNEVAANRLDSAYRHEVNYTRLAKEFNIDKVAPGADAFLICTEKYPAINLYHTDNSHHSAAGAYLLGCVMAITYLDIDIDTIDYDSRLDAETASALRECAKIACEEGFDYPQDN